MRRIAIWLGTLALLLGLTGCTDKNTDYIFRYDLAQRVLSLDPQFATREADRLVIANVFEGLMSQNSQGELAPGAASGYTVSSDGLRYTFTLREGLVWSDGSPLTGEDFRFALQRLFDPASPSPHASSLLCLENAQEILDGERPLDDLGVESSANTLVLRLAYPNPELPTLLSASYTMPCNKQFFLEQRGRYGVDRSTVLYNGPFTVTGWEKQRVSLRKNPNYTNEEPVLAAGVNLYVQTEGDPADRLLSGSTDGAVVSHSRREELGKAGCTLQGLEDTTWALVFNQQTTDYSQPAIRQALAFSIDRERVAQSLSGDAQHTDQLIPPALHLLGHNYRDLAGTVTPHRGESPRTLLADALAQQGKTRLDRTDLLVPDSSMERTMAGALQRSWQDGINANINILPLEMGTLESRVASGDYQIALISLRSLSGSVEEILRQFGSDSPQNLARYQNEEYDRLLTQAAAVATVEGTAKGLAAAEEKLLTDGVVVPLYNTATYTATAPKVRGIQFDGAVSGCYFKYAVKE